MRPFDGNAAQLLLELGGAAGVIDVAVREEDLFGRDAGLGDAGLDPIEVAAGVDDGALLALLVPQQRAVLLERVTGTMAAFRGMGRLPTLGCALLAPGPGPSPARR